MRLLRWGNRFVACSCIARSRSMPPTNSRHRSPTHAGVYVAIRLGKPVLIALHGGGNCKRTKVAEMGKINSPARQSSLDSPHLPPRTAPGPAVTGPPPPFQVDSVIQTAQTVGGRSAMISRYAQGCRYWGERSGGLQARAALSLIAVNQCACRKRPS